jgi:hypothetical protein
MDLSLRAGQPVDTVLDALRPPANDVSPEAVRMLASLMLQKLDRAALAELEAGRSLYRLCCLDPEIEEVSRPMPNWQRL